MLDGCVSIRQEVQIETTHVPLIAIQFRYGQRRNWRALGRILFFRRSLLQRLSVEFRAMVLWLQPNTTSWRYRLACDNCQDDASLRGGAIASLCSSDIGRKIHHMDASYGLAWKPAWRFADFLSAQYMKIPEPTSGYGIEKRRYQISKTTSFRTDTRNRMCVHDTMQLYIKAITR